MDQLTEGAELLAESGRTYLAVHALGQANVWIAAQKDDPSQVVVLKGPAADEQRPWYRFQNEMVMHELFKPCKHIRRQIDRISPVPGTTNPPILVLEIFETTLWHVRTKRPLSRAEIVAIAADILRGLQEVHAKGLVYADLKMQNVMINGFDPEKPQTETRLRAKLGDLGIVMSPSYGKVQPVSYRAPEVYFKQFIGEAADIWAFGLVCCHLLEAKARFDKTGLYDDLYDTNTSMTEREQAVRYALANDYDLRTVDYYKDVPLPYRDSSRAAGSHWDELRLRGLEHRDVDFLRTVLIADPRERLTAAALLRSLWFQDRAETTLSKSPEASHNSVLSNGPAESAMSEAKATADAVGEPHETAPRPAYLGAKSASGGTFLSYS